MTETEHARMRAEDHATLSSIRLYLRWFAGGGFVVVVGAIWFLAQGWAQVERNTREIDALRSAMTAVSAREAARDVAMSRLEERLASITGQLSRIERTLERIAREEPKR